MGREEVAEENQEGQKGQEGQQEQEEEEKQAGKETGKEHKEISHTCTQDGDVLCDCPPSSPLPPPPPPPREPLPGLAGYSSRLRGCWAHVKSRYSGQRLSERPGYRLHVCQEAEPWP